MDKIQSLRELADTNPARAPEIIEGILRERETANIIAAPKTGKTWLMIQLALSLAQGKAWLGRKVTQKKVLVIDNELQPSELHWRYKKVADAMNVAIDDLEGQLFIWAQRGNLRSVTELSERVELLKMLGVEVVLLDAFYRALPPGTDENNNTAIMQIYNKIDNLAHELGCAFILVHHTAKGKQSEKATTDMGAGAGAQSRAADTHLVLMPNATFPGTIEIRGVTRSFAPFESFRIKQFFPLWSRIS